jgi:hypothetical protein
MERFKFIFLVAGIGFFALAFVVSAWLPMLPVQDMEVKTIAQLAENVPLDFVLLSEEYPEAFENAFGAKADSAAFAAALVRGHKIYIGEACWHCHSQQIRPWGGDEARFGRQSYPEEFHNELNMPPLWGTRRVGPDLSRLGGSRSNDWHVAHFWNPPDVASWSVMPRYPWFYEDDGKTPNRDGLAIITYVQWLGSWHDNIDVNMPNIGEIQSKYVAPRFAAPVGTESADAPAPEPDAASENAGDDDDYGY